MNDHTKSFGETAKSLARNPFGIIALVYWFGSLVTAFAESFTSAERPPLIYFLIFFPVMMKSPLLFQDGFGDLFA